MEEQKKQPIILPLLQSAPHSFANSLESLVLLSHKILKPFLCLPNLNRPKKKPQKMSLNPQEQLRTARTTWQNEGREVEISSILVHPSFAAAAAAAGLYCEKSWLWHWGGDGFFVFPRRKEGRRREYY